MTGQRWMKWSIALRVAALGLAMAGGATRIMALHKLDHEKYDSPWDQAAKEELAKEAAEAKKTAADSPEA